MKIFLIGFMGVGKTTLGIMLSRKLELPFLDLDEIIEDQMAMSISDVFKQHGESYFRKIEKEALRDVSIGYENVILSTGGGLPCHFDNMQFMSEQGITIYLRATPEDLASRLRGRMVSRPVLAGRDDELSSFIENLLAKRDGFYSQADIAVDLAIDADKADNTALIVKALRQHLSENSLLN